MDPFSNKTNFLDKGYRVRKIIFILLLTLLWLDCHSPLVLLWDFWRSLPALHIELKPYVQTFVMQ